MSDRPSPPLQLSLAKRLAFSAVVVVAFLLLLEGLLALVGVQALVRDEDPFVGFAGRFPLFSERVGRDGVPRLVTSRNKSAFFNEQSFRSDKGEGTTRIFCLGGSTTYGRPYADPTSFAGWLRELLPEADRARRWEVVNAGGISYASYRVAALVEELVAYEPDLFVVYTGHNEFLEERTYRELREIPGPLRTLMGWLSRTRTWAALSGLGPQRGGAAEARTDEGRSILPQEVRARLDNSAGPALYEREDGLTEQVLDHYRLSLERIVRMAREGGARVLLVVPASNIKDCTPFKGEPSPGLDDAARGRLRELEARRADAGADTALPLLDEALALDPRNADLLFERGRLRLEQGDFDGAEADFRAARDEDVCPLRATTRMQEIVREVAGDLDVPLVDYPALLRAEAVSRRGHAILGEEFFLDHVHPTIEGHRLLALALVEEMSTMGLLNPEPGWGPAALERVVRRVEARIDPAEHARALANLSLTLNWAGKNEESRRLARRALDSGYEDATMLMMVARHEALEGNDAAAADYFRRALDASPNSPVVHSQAGLLHSGRGDLEAAAAHFFLASLLWEDNEVYHEQLAATMSQRGRPRAALRSLRRAAALNPADAELLERIERVRARLLPNEREVPEASISVSRHPSGFPRTVAQSSPGADGTPRFDGIWTEWYEDGRLAAFADYREGRLVGSPVRWSREGARQR